ncbi:hypothetical protein MKW94_010616 [Papaver nudicaule]|uniref:Uncharacterized protein n=1 Tax=Papaver nudicaule TaxID=74823 RepID=A0AA41W3B2_PAPNU|nr:hypothetical protein [Papaver nudicaule]
MAKEVFTYEINWVVVYKYALHEKVRSWISDNTKNSTDEEADDLVSDILESSKNHALSILEKIMSFCLVNEVESERLSWNMRAMLFFKIKKLGEVRLIRSSAASKTKTVHPKCWNCLKSC